MYKSTWGWSDKRKSAELRHEDARFIVASQSTLTNATSSAPLAFLHFRCAAIQIITKDAMLVCQSISLSSFCLYLHSSVYRFEPEDSTPVLYIYEIQLEDSCQRKGLGKLMMKLMELVAIKKQMESIMLTVMHNNQSANHLYAQLGYSKHCSSPENGVDGQCGYDILHKPMRTLSARA